MVSLTVMLNISVISRWATIVQHFFHGKLLTPWHYVIVDLALCWCCVLTVRTRSTTPVEMQRLRCCIAAFTRNWLRTLITNYGLSMRDVNWQYPEREMHSVWNKNFAMTGIVASPCVCVFSKSHIVKIMDQHAGALCVASSALWRISRRGTRRGQMEQSSPCISHSLHPSTKSCGLKGTGRVLNWW